MLVGDNAMEVARNRAHIAIDRPLVVIQHNDQPLGLVGDIVQCFKRDAVGERSVAGNRDHMLFAAGQVTRHRHAQRSRKRGTRMPRTVAVVLAFGPQHEAVEPAGLANGREAIEPAGKNFVNVSLVAHVEEDAVRGSIEDRSATQA